METQQTLQAAIDLFRQGLHYQALDQITQLHAVDPDAGKAWELTGLIPELGRGERFKEFCLDMRRGFVSHNPRLEAAVTTSLCPTFEKIDLLGFFGNICSGLWTIRAIWKNMSKIFNETYT